jgi:hypothetical protein
MDFGFPNRYVNIPGLQDYWVRHYVDGSLRIHFPAYEAVTGAPYDSWNSNDGRNPESAAHLDALIEESEKRDKKDPVDVYFLGKRRFLSDSIADILGLIYGREHLKDENLRKIDYDSILTKERLFQIDYWRAGWNPNVDRLRMNLERELIGFGREKRLEEVACWRDVCRLKSELREVSREFAVEKRRQSLLSGES